MNEVKPIVAGTPLILKQSYLVSTPSVRARKYDMYLETYGQTMQRPNRLSCFRKHIVEMLCLHQGAIEHGLRQAPGLSRVSLEYPRVIGE